MNLTSKIQSIAGFCALAFVITSCQVRNDNTCGNVLEQTYVHKYGVTVPSDYWQASGADGVVVSMLDDGIMVSRSYSSGILDGNTTYTYPHSSQVQYSETYQNGNLIKETEFYFDGTPKEETAYNLYEPSSKVVSTWYLTASPRSLENYKDGLLVSGEYFTSSNQRDALIEGMAGTRLVRDDYGQLIATDKITQGLMTERTVYHPSGTPKEIIPYNNNAVDGYKRTFLQAGEPSTIEQWSAGQQHGTTTVYKHGEIFAEVPYVTGEKNGVEVRYRDNGDKAQEITWNAGKMHGPATTYAGDVEKTDWYFKSKQVTKADFDFMSNKPVAR